MSDVHEHNKAYKLNECLQNFTIEDIETLIGKYSSKCFSTAFVYFFHSKKYTHDHLINVMNILTSNMDIYLEYMYVIPGTEDFIEYLLMHNHIDPTEMWNEAIFQGLQIVEMPDTRIYECILDTLSLSVKHGSDIRFLSGYGKTYTWEELDIYIKNKSKNLRRGRGRARKEMGRIRRTYKYVLKLCLPIRRRPFILKRIRGFSSDEEHSEFDDMFVKLPPELFCRVLNFMM